MNKYHIASYFLAAVALAGCSDKPAQKARLDYNLPMSEYQSAYKTRLAASNPSTWKPAACAVTVPESGIELPENSLFRQALEKNTHYLLHSFSVNHMLVPFRIRAGEANPPDDSPQLPFWDVDLRGSSAGRFMMGAGNMLRWMENKELRARLDELIDGIEACREKDGYILAYPHHIDSIRSEEANYARAWFTHGLIEAGLAGNPKAYGLLRGHADCFNSWDELHPQLMYRACNNHQGHIASTRTYLSPVGKPEDLHVAEKYYVCDWWMDELEARRDSAVWQYPLPNPHSYLITSFEAYLDHYLATGDKSYLNAMLGAWDLIRDKWQHVGGSIAICEAMWEMIDGKRLLRNGEKPHNRHHPPRSYSLTNYGHTGETCGSVFWIKFNQRFHRLFPNEEKYVAEIEKTIYNVLLASQKENGLIRYHAIMEGCKEQPEECTNTCCEGQGARALGSLPEYIYSLAPDGIYINMYEPSTIRWKVDGQDVALQQETRFPLAPEVGLKITTQSPIKMKLRVRAPSWATGKTEISVNGEKAATGLPGTYVELARKWSDGDKITFTLPIGLKTTRYAGVDTVAGVDRYATEYGPILLAAVIENKDANRVFDLSRITPDASRPLHFNLTGNPSRYLMPYMQISDEAFTTFPLNGKRIAGFTLEDHIAKPGFAAEFFANDRWEGEPVYKANVLSIDYPAESKESKRPIAPGVPTERFSSRFTGEFTAPATGTLVFAVSSNEGYRLSVNNNVVSQYPGETTQSAFFSAVEVAKGEKYILKLEHSQEASGYRIMLKADLTERN